MFNGMLRDILYAYGASGREETVAEVIRGYVAPLADELYTDVLGNLIAHKRGTSGRKLMLCAHMDRIGLVVTDIDERGFLRVMNVGGVSAAMAIGRAVRFENGIMGVTYYETEKKTHAEAQLKELFIDIGATSFEDAAAKVRIGDMAVFEGSLIELGPLLASPVMDDRVCCAMIVEAMKELDSPHDIYAVFSVQEEVGLRGAGAAAYAIKPDLAIALDVTWAGDTPKSVRRPMKLSAGPCVKILDHSVIVPEDVRDLIVAAAEREDIPYQYEVLFGGGTDTGAIQRTAAGIRAGCISLPCRYVHSPVETVSRMDMENTVRLIRAIASSDI